MMSKFTPGRWWIAPPIFDGDVIFAPPTVKGRCNDVVATCILNKADARLIAAAPEMYELLVDYHVDPAEQIAWLIRRHHLLARIDGEEAHHG